ncbi:NAD(P)-dependent oxidoreductase [uncultured Clostridium sp.]|uniref:NAD(P)-dependent oxidoreductase n=1 Tax=uncultured Clostridium sp. TaxID=59620 RepID=UPI0025E41522|nr:NAD(P)H-binding protein [uncultured Clostridium sp.]
MNVIIFGATGGIGKWAVKHALEKGYNVTAYVRNSQKVKTKDNKLTIVQGEIYDYDKVKSALAGQNAVIWCVGIPMKNKLVKLESQKGHEILLKAMKEQGVKRLIDWGTPSVAFEKDKKSFITVVPGIMAGIMFSKAKAEMVDIGQMLKKSDLDWTMVRFLMPQNTAYTGKVKVGFGDVKMNFAISREDIGAFMVEQVESKKYIKSMPIIGS